MPMWTHREDGVWILNEPEKFVAECTTDLLERQLADPIHAKDPEARQRNEAFYEVVRRELERRKAAEKPTPPPWGRRRLSHADERETVVYNRSEGEPCRSGMLIAVYGRWAWVHWDGDECPSQEPCHVLWVSM